MFPWSSEGGNYDLIMSKLWDLFSDFDDGYSNVHIFKKALPYKAISMSRSMETAWIEDLLGFAIEFAHSLEASLQFVLWKQVCWINSRVANI